MPQPADHLSLLCLGTGRGATSVYDGETSCSVVLMADGEPLLLVDVGFGVTRACKQAIGRIPERILITHNHSDHAAELPVLLAVERTDPPRIRLIAATEVASRVQQHRLHELDSTGRPATDFCSWQVAGDGEPMALAGAWSLTLHKSRHSEACHGFILYEHDRAVFAYGSDSGFDATYYEALWRAPHVVLDARDKGSDEHAGFDEVEAWIGRNPPREVWITGYGRPDQRPGTLRTLHPGGRITLLAG